jgi:hypothetical protein
MYFTKDEIIELNDHKRYLVLDTLILDDIVYYKIKELSQEETLIGNNLYITTINKEGKIYINDKLSLEEIDKIKDLFES